MGSYETECNCDKRTVWMFSNNATGWNSENVFLLTILSQVNPVARGFYTSSWRFCFTLLYGKHCSEQTRKGNTYDQLPKGFIRYQRCRLSWSLNSLLGESKGRTLSRTSLLFLLTDFYVRLLSYRYSLPSRFPLLRSQSKSLASPTVR